MAEQPPLVLTEDITPPQFFEQLLPLGFAAQASAGAPDAVLAYRLTGEGGGEWTVRIAGGAMTVARGAADESPLASFHRSHANA